ncbi:hypothetical protein BVX98_00585 [bacterium F11]|nr:hypothetical protein BVX98_00585 [bacterium F11]
MKILIFVSLLFSFFFCQFSYSQNQGGMSDKRKAVKYIAELKSHSSKEKIQAAEELARLDDRGAVRPLIGLLEDKDFNVRQTVAYALGELGDKQAAKPLLARMEKENPNGKVIFIRALGKVGDSSVVDSLLPLLKHNNSSVVFETVQALGRFDDPVVSEAFLSSLKSQDEYGCMAIVNVLTNNRIKKAEKAFLDLTKDKRRPSCALVAVDGLGWVGGEEAVGALIMILKKNDSSSFKNRALRSLGRLRAREAFDAIHPFLRHKEAVIRRSAVEALVGLGDHRAIPMIKGLQGDPSPEVQKTVQYALRQFGVKQESSIQKDE